MTALPDSALDQVFRTARSYNRWSDAPITDTDIQAIYDLTKFGPTAANSSPARFVWIRSPEAKAKFLPYVADANKVKVEQAAATVIIAYDLDFPETLDELFPHAPGAKNWFGDPVAKEASAFRNSSLQGAYLLLAARSLGFDTGPMSGFDNAGVDAAFFAGTNIKSNFISAIGHGTDESLFPRSPRLAFDKANTVL